MATLEYLSLVKDKEFKSLIAKYIVYEYIVYDIAKKFNSNIIFYLFFKKTIIFNCYFIVIDYNGYK